MSRVPTETLEAEDVNHWTKTQCPDIKFFPERSEDVRVRFLCGVIGAQC